MEVKLTILMAYPDRLRQEMVLPFGTITSVLSPEDAFVISPQGTSPIPDSQRAEAEKSMRRTPLVLLKARNQPGFVAAAAGKQDIGGKSVQAVQVEWMGDVTTLGIDEQTGQIVSMVFQGMHPMTQARGEITQVMSDYRPAGGVMLPYRMESSFNGEAFLTSTTESLEVNKPVAGDAFTRPETVTAKKDGQ
jgi:hypothetical protein